MTRYDSACAICGGTDLLPFGRRADGIPVRQCAACGHGMVEYFRDDVQDLYEDRYFAGKSDSAVGYQEYLSTAEQGVAWAASLLRLLKPSGRVLDIGCANGVALQFLGEGYDRFGIELNEGMARLAAGAGIRIIAHDLFEQEVEQRYSGSFDAVLAIAVFEHIPDIKRAVRTAMTLLKPDGILIFEVPLVQFAGDIWYRSSLEHLHYPTKSSIEYLFREILHVSLTGSVIQVQDFGGTYIGVTSPGAEAALQAGSEYRRLTTADPARLEGSEARFRWYLDLMHAAQSTPEILALYRHLGPQDRTAASLQRLVTLWTLREEKLANASVYLSQIESRAEQTAQQLAVQQRELEEAVEARKWQEEADIWRQIAGQREEALAALRAAQVALEEQIRSFRQVAEEQSSQIAALESSENGLRLPVEGLRAVIQQENKVPPLSQESRFTSGLTRGASRGRIVKAWRSGMLVLSPRWLASNIKNLYWWLRLILGSPETRALWKSGFDGVYYERTYPDVERAGIYPSFHYVFCGYREDRNPSERFDSAFYLARNSDVRLAGINPLLHYCLYGKREERSPLLPLKATPVQVPVPRPLRPPLQRPLPVAPVEAPENDDSGPLLSVVIPCFNYGRYVEQAIYSVLEQTFHNIEIIVIEGGSTDGVTPSILRELERQGLPKTRFVFRAEPHLVGDNRNFGIQQARGRYVCCLDADDLIKPIYLEVAVFLAEFGGYDVVYPSVRCFGESDFRWLLTDAAWPAISDGNQISTVAIFRKTVWRQVGGFRDWGTGPDHVPEDWEFWVRVLGHGFSCKCIQEPLMLYRTHGDGLWATCGSTLEQQRQAIRDATPHLFANGYVPPAISVKPPAPSWNRLLEIPGANPSILLALPFITIGGAEKVFETLLQSLIRRGYRVVIITTLVLAETIRDCTENFEAITPYVYPFQRLLRNQESRWKDFLFYLLTRHHIDTILIAGCDFLYQLLPEIARDFPDIAILDQLFNDEVHYHSNRHYASYIDLTFVPSQKLADKLITEGGEHPAKVSIIPHGINIDEAVVSTPPFESSGLPDHFRGKFLVSFFGRLSPEKGPLDFVKIARRLRSNDDICFLMTGEGQERAAVLALIERHGLRSRIHTPGFVDNTPALMALSDVIVVPSILDGMPLVVFEAQACGKPVVASSVGSIPHVIADGETGFLCVPGDVAGFAARILELLRSPELRRKIGETASAWVRAHHSAEAMADQYVKVFDQVRSNF